MTRRQLVGILVLVTIIGNVVGFLFVVAGRLF